jgi:hypothetical protein
MQDIDYPDVDEYGDQFDYIMPLCFRHAEFIAKNHPKIESKLWIGSNGIKTDLIREIEAEGVPERNPYRLIYSSSPDRGLEYLLKIVDRAQEFIPELELHIFYGFQNINSKYLKNVKYIQKIKENVENGIAAGKNIYWHDRVTQKELYKEFLKSNLWVYSSTFSESSCISCMEAQALGAIPITNPWWALEQNVHFGTFIQGNPYTDELVRSRYVGEIIRAVKFPWSYNQRLQMMETSRQFFSWERFLDRWEAFLLRGYISGFPTDHFWFQVRHAADKGPIINIGCDADNSNLKLDYGAINVDIRSVSPLGYNNKVDVCADARNLPESLYGKFKVAILGDILEHFTKDEDVIKVLEEAKKTLIDSESEIIITVPEDHRTLDQVLEDKERHGFTQPHVEEYVEDVKSYHWRPITKEIVEDWCKKANLEITFYRPIDCNYFIGHGFVCRRKENG